VSRRAALLALLGLLVAAAPARAQAPAPPLVYVFVIDGLDGDAVDAGDAPFIASLLRGDDGSRATYWRESRSIMVAETNPNHVAMATGAYADGSGIPGNAFAVRGATDGGTCPATTSASAPPAETDGQSPECLRAETFFAAVERWAPGLVTAGIFGKPKLARIFAGRGATAGRYDADYLWTPCLPQGDDTPYCKRVPARPNDGYAVSDSSVMDEVLRTVREGVRGDGKTFTGGGARPGLTFVNFPTVDSAGHGAGRGAAYDAAVAAADGEIERFVAQQKELGLWGRTVMVLLSDHSMESTPDKSSLTARFTAAGISSDDYAIVQNGSAAFVYAARRDAGRFAVLERLRAAALGDSAAPLAGPPAVEALYREPNPEDGGSRFTLDAVHPAWRLAGSDRTGDLVVTAPGPAGAFNEPNPLTGNHGGPQTRDNFFAAVGGGTLVRPQAIAGAVDPRFDDTERNPGQAENVDVAPTVARLLGVRAPAQSAGRFLAEAFDIAQLPPAAAGGAGARGACARSSGFRSASVRPSGRGLRFAFARRGRGAVTADVFQASIGRRVLGNRRIARFRGRTRSFRWAGRRARDGQLFARLRTVGPDGRADVRRFALARRGGRFVRRPAFYRRASCGAISSFKLERPVFGGRANAEVDATYRLGARATTTLELLRGSRRVRRLAPTRARAAGRAYRVRIAAEGLRRGDYRVRLTVRRGGKTTRATLTARKL
jgi:hypothetical protein